MAGLTSLRWRRHRSTICSGGLLLSLAGCSGSPAEISVPPPSSHEAQPSPPPVPTALDSSPEASFAPPSGGIFDRETLRALEGAGLDFGSRLAGLPQANNAELHTTRAWPSIVEHLDADVLQIQRRDPNAGISIARHSHRLFDLRFLRAARAHFRLIGVVPRIDRRPFQPEFCGETRLVYRLTSQGPLDRGAPSALPLTLIFEYRARPLDETGCQLLAQSWSLPNQASPSQIARHLTREGAPLHLRALSHEQLIQIASNLQIVRWPSTVRPDLGGHAEYSLRAFRWELSTQSFQPRPLENTPDVIRLNRDPKLKAELLDWLRTEEIRRAVDRGDAKLPDRFAAEQITSVSPRGLSRLTNRPFHQLFTSEDFEDLPWEEGRMVRTSRAYLHRLDESSCAGCHQTRSIAGFHLLGEDAEEDAAGTALEVSTSPHFMSEWERRKRMFASWAAQEIPDEVRPFAERAPDEPGIWGSACALDADPSFSSWICAEGLSCHAQDTPRGHAGFGRCLPLEPEVGDPCEIGPLNGSSNPHRDRVTAVERRACAEGQVCNRNQVGFPGGMCTASCSDERSSVRCGPLAILDPFNSCLARGLAFTTCLTQHTRAAGLRACDASAPCRDDYACARSANGGVCVPPYFLFQLRVDGHEFPD